MRIAFLGKGGAGKTTMAAGFVRYLSGRHEFVLAVDADVNVHLSASLQFPASQILLGELFEEVADYLKGARTDLGGRIMIGSTPPSLNSRFIRVAANDPFIKKYAVQCGNIALLTVGPYAKSDVGGNCYHAKLESFTSIMHHILDRDSDVIVADTTAGTDNVATSLNMAYDLNAFVVEPTKKSLDVYRDFIALVPHLEETVYVLANKVDGEKDANFIRSNIPANRLIGMVSHSRQLKRFEQGETSAVEEFHLEQQPVFDQLYSVLATKKRNWDVYSQRLREAHEKLCRDWYNDYFGLDMGVGYDANFSYQRAMQQIIGAPEPALVV